MMDYTAGAVAEAGSGGAIGSGSWGPWGEESHGGRLSDPDATKQREKDNKQA